MEKEIPHRIGRILNIMHVCWSEVGLCVFVCTACGDYSSRAQVFVMRDGASDVVRRLGGKVMVVSFRLCTKRGACAFRRSTLRPARLGGRQCCLLWCSSNINQDRDVGRPFVGAQVTQRRCKFRDFRRGA